MHIWMATMFYIIKTQRAKRSHLKRKKQQIKNTKSVSIAIQVSLIKLRGHIKFLIQIVYLIIFVFVKN